MNSLRKYINIVSENISDETFDLIINAIKTDCQPWLQAMDKPLYHVYRGLKEYPNNEFFKKEIKIDRRPKDMKTVWYNTINKLIHDKGLIADRANSAFVTGDSDMASQYGKPFIFLPIGKFNYTWSYRLRDAYNDIQEYHFTKYKNPDEYRKKIEDEVNSQILEYTRDLNLTKERLQLELSKDNKNSAVISNLEHDVFFFSRVLSNMNNPTYIDAKMGSNLLHFNDEFMEVNYPAFKEYYYETFQGDDGSLREAIASHNEILIHAQAAYYVNVGIYNSIRNVLK